MYDYIVSKVLEVGYEFVVDAHCHVTTDALTLGEIESVLQRAVKHRVVMITNPLTGREREKTLGYLKKYSGWLYMSAGVHPLHNEPVDEVVRWIREHEREVIAIGEVGLDFTPPYNSPSVIRKQREKFEAFIRLARELDKPLVVHSRGAGRQAIDFLIMKGAERVLLHAFSGKAKYALKGVEAGYYFSIPPSALFSPQKKKLVKLLPLEVMLLETDSPIYSVRRGVPTEPLHVLISAAAISAIKEVDIKDVIKVTTTNALKLFRIPKPPL